MAQIETFINKTTNDNPTLENLNHQEYENDNIEEQEWDEYDDDYEEDEIQNPNNNQSENVNNFQNTNSDIQIEKRYVSKEFKYGKKNYDSGYTHKKSYEEKRKKGRYHKKSNKYYGNDNLSKTFTNKNYDNKYNGDFINKNSNYAKKSINYKNNNNNNNSHYTIKKNIFFNSSKKEEEEDIKKPMFINSKLENNGNPDGNFIKLDQDFPKYNFIPNGEISDNKNNKNENENEKKNQNDNPVINHINLSMSLNFEKNLILDNNKSYNESQKHHYHYKNKHYDNNKGFNHNKNYKGNNFNLNQPSSRGFNNNNKFDNYNKSKNYYYDGGTKFKK